MILEFIMNLEKRNMPKLMIANALLFGSIGILFAACNSSKAEYQQNSCKRMPAFVQRLGYASANFETNDDRNMGLWLRQREKAGDINSKIIKQYQHPSWKSAGWLAPVLLDDKGNIYTAPAPFVNVLSNPQQNRNTVYRVDPQTGVLAEWVRIPAPDSNIQNAFGIISMVYLCEAGVLYASSFAGSDRRHEKGGIYAIDTKTGKIIDKITGVDAFGVGINYIEGKRKLYFGSGRHSDVYSVELDKKGKFVSKPAFCLSIADKGDRGDDKVRKIVTNSDGSLTIIGYEFNFNLIAPREKQETPYTFYFDEESGNWITRQ